MLLLDIRNLTIELKTPEGSIRAVDKVNFSLKEGEVRGLVGESGSGKSLIAKAIVGVLNQRWDVTADRLHWQGEDLMHLTPEKRREIISRDVAMIYQEPSRCLDPTALVGEQLEEAIPVSDGECSYLGRKAYRKKKTEALLHKVGIKNHVEVIRSYPHELSEGVCQKIMIAIAIAKKPKLLIADEPTTALESATQAQIFRLLKSLNQLKNMSIILISHDLETITSWTHSISVLYCGQLVESGTTEQIFNQPFHPYTQALIKSVPDFRKNIEHKSRLYTLKGTIPTLQHLPIGCRLGPRCPQAQKTCVETPSMRKIQNHYVSCHFPLNQNIVSKKKVK
ncbi:peptide ABC transporter ATP-binding protein [Flocculibacter collagenilyticus]|uniref:peptide ABC transporter ATP-binding protein n=1 Tax=Flocculibacter collagenilyticus TaxID=2744479 RepID=UPI0018F47986|nr:oligopeptide/dipeptide ABC transporter ATP-binding protein [Flocculibacter collagenilyticus]